MLVFVEKIGHKYDFLGEWGGLWQGLVVGVVVVQIQRKKVLTDY